MHTDPVVHTDPAVHTLGPVAVGNNSVVDSPVVAVEQHCTVRDIAPVVGNSAVEQRCTVVGNSAVAAEGSTVQGMMGIVVRVEPLSVLAQAIASLARATAFASLIAAGPWVTASALVTPDTNAREEAFVRSQDVR